MGYYELLPKRKALLDDLHSIGVTGDKDADMVVDAVTDFLDKWADYYHTQYEINGDKQDLGARDALRELCAELNE